MLPKLSVIQISVTDMEAAVAFYEKFGFEVEGEKKNAPQFVELRHLATEQPNHISFILALTKAVAEDPYPHGTQTLLNIETDNLDTEMINLKSKGVQFIHDTPQRFPVGRFAALKDPFGNVLELVEFDKSRPKA